MTQKEAEAPFLHSFTHIYIGIEPIIFSPGFRIFELETTSFLPSHSLTHFAGADPS